MGNWYTFLRTRVDVSVSGRTGGAIALALGIGAIAVAGAQEFGQPIVFESQFPATTPVSVTALVAAPRDWDGKVVRVSGFLHAEFHGVTLFGSSEHCELLMEGYGVGISIDSIAPEITRDELPDGECVVADVHGTFFSTPFPQPGPNSLSVGSFEPGEIHAKYLRIR